MFRFLFATLFIVHFSGAMLKDETWALRSKQRITTIDAVPTSYKPVLRHAIQNNAIISLLFTTSTQYTRIRKNNTETISARFLDDNTTWDTRAAEKSFYELIAKYQLEDKTSEEIMAACNHSRTINQ